MIKLAAFSAPAKVVQKIFNFAIGEYCRNLEYWIKQGYIKITDSVFSKLLKILKGTYDFPSGVVFTKFIKHLIINNKSRWRNAVRYLIKELVANKVDI